MRAITLAVTAALLLAATGCSSSDTDADDKPGPSNASSASEAAGGALEAAPEKKHLDDVKITKHGVENHEVWGPDAYVFHYKITNSGDKAANYFAQIEFLDTDGDVLGTTGITADKLGPGKTSTGDSAPVEAEIQNGKISDIRDVRISQVDRSDPETP